MGDNIRVNDDEQVEYVEESSSIDGERREEVTVVREEDAELEERIVENVGAERRAVMNKVTNFIWLLAGILEGLLGLRFMLKLIAANPNAPFVSLVYRVTDLFLWPFAGITVTPSANGMVLEISSLIAMFVYALAFWIIVRLLHIGLSPTSSRRVSVRRREDL